MRRKNRVTPIIFGWPLMKRCKGLVPPVLVVVVVVFCGDPLFPPGPGDKHSSADIFIDI